MSDARPEGARQSIGMFGGTFDPIHVGHLLLAELAREELGLDRVLFVPANIPPHKRAGRMIAPSDCRIAMLELATAANRAFEISTHEIDREGVSYTVETLRHFEALRPAARFTLLIGADNARDFRTWREPERIVELADVAVWARPGSEMPEVFRQRLDGVEETLGYRVTPEVTLRVSHRARRGFGRPDYDQTVGVSAVWWRRWM